MVYISPLDGSRTARRVVYSTRFPDDGIGSHCPMLGCVSALRMIRGMGPLATMLERELRLRSRDACINSPRDVLAGDAVRFREAIALPSGALATWSPAISTGRIPQDTYTVHHPDDDSVDWLQPNNRPLPPHVFDSLFHDALHLLAGKKRLYVTDRSLGADGRYALPIRTITDSALVALFTDTMFRPPQDAEPSALGDTSFTLLVLPNDRIDALRYRGTVREVNGKPVDVLAAVDFRRRSAVVFGSRYLGIVKKLAFTAMNGLLPEHGVLPIHCSAVIDPQARTHLLLGLSGTGKTTLSSAPGLNLIGDDEHLWSERGVANMENGCYAKLIRLSREQEPGIHEAVFGEGNGARSVIVENAMAYPDGTVDLDDARLTENSRAAYPLSRLRSSVPVAQGGQPSTILFLTADARGVLPPVAKLPMPQAMLWYLLGYTSKVAGTETGITRPASTFSRFFGAPFMSRKSQDYLRLFQSYVGRYRPAIYLINTGWSGGPPGVGKRMPIAATRRMVDAALRGQLENVSYREDKLFHLLVPRECPGIDEALLDPRNAWKDPRKYEEESLALAREFSDKFETLSRGESLDALSGKCPGR